MQKVRLPLTRVMSKAFQERGRDDVTQIDVFPITYPASLRLVFLAKNSPWNQGVFLLTDESILVNGHESSATRIWYEGAPSEVPVTAKSSNGVMHVYNVWDRGFGSNSLSWSSGMLIQDIPNGRLYRCNDIGFEGSFDKLVFKIERVPDLGT